MIRTKAASPSLAPRLIGGMVFFALLAAFFYQQGYENHDSTACLIVAVVALAGLVACTITLAAKCPQAANDPTNFSAPLVPLVPALCILANFYLISQISHLGLALGCGWVALGVFFYFAYGFKHAAGRTGWSDLMRYHLPSNCDGADFAPILTMTEVRPSMSSLVKEQ
ncbi:hypothetical protein PybrP1_003771 [[Pythium] brassicae (nom. inval.)]|nr:hypothetical protein PybrP1_003771 [[Pythium] brassicae (nom. inval.)]